MEDHLTYARMIHGQEIMGDDEEGDGVRNEETR
jgi:hypothetical protein